MTELNRQSGENEERIIEIEIERLRPFKEHPFQVKDVLYRVTPVFEGSNLVASGVLMEAESVEDKGEGILGVSCFWSIKELKEQEKRVAKGWFPKRKVDKH